MGFGKVFRPEKLPSLSRIPKELGRSTRQCGRCGRETEQVYYRVPKKVAFFYLKDHEENLHATCLECAHSAVVTGEERDRVMHGEACGES